MPRRFGDLAGALVEDLGLRMVFVSFVERIAGKRFDEREDSSTIRVLEGFLFSGLQTGAFGMERRAGVPRELARVVQALVILLLAAGTRFHFGRARSG